MGKDSVITFRISAISAVGGVEGVSSVASVTFSSGASAFLFFETAAFGSGVDFVFLEIFSSSLTILAACLLRMLTTLFFYPFNPFVKFFIIRVVKIQGIHHPV
jgi:hypothetical protein